MSMLMMMSKRERYAAIGAAAAVLLLALNYFIFMPYTDERNDLDSRSAGLYQKQDDANTLFDRQRRLTRVWNQMQKGLNVDSSTAESQAEQAVIDWADASGMTLTGLRPGKTAPENGFLAISFTATGTGSMPDIAHMLWSLESATIPVRISDMQLKPRKEGTDDLLATFTVSALCLPPSSETADHALTSASAWNRDIAP
jgi:hypothetical protein